MSVNIKSKYKNQIHYSLGGKNETEKSSFS